MSGPLSERYRLAGKEWVELDNKARLMEETKSAVLSQQMAALGDMAVSKAELKVKASDFWMNFIKEMVESRTQDRKSTRLNSSHSQQSRMPSSA